MPPGSCDGITIPDRGSTWEDRIRLEVSRGAPWDELCLSPSTGTHLKRSRVQAILIASVLHTVSTLEEEIG